MGPEIELQERSDGFKGSGKDECPESKDESVAMSEAKDTLHSAAGGLVLVEAHSQDETESSCSSSFGGTASESEDAINTVGDEDELNLFGNNSLALDINEAGQLMRVRKRKLTNHWKTYIQPLKWRCKWTELQVKKLKAFALRYDRKLRNNNQKRQNLMKRKKRRIGDKMNPTSYMSNHPLFSYFDKKVLRIAPGASLEQGGRNQEKVSGSSESGVLEERLWVESGIGDNSLEELLKKIELLQAKVREQKSRLEQVEDTKPKAVMVPPSNTTRLTQPSAAPANNGTRTPIIASNTPSRLTSLYGKGSVVMPKSAVSSHGGVSMSGVHKGKDRLTRVGEEFVKAENDVLIYDERLKEGMQNYDLTIPMKNSPVTKEKLQNTSSKALIEPEPQIKLQRPLKMQHVSQLTPPKKRKIGGRQKSSPSKLQRTS